jgi:fructose 5-dehydrogenase cytochrome subunit
MTRLKTLALGAGALLIGGFSLAAQAQDAGGADPSLVERGHYLATAGDCAACHGDNAAGGLAIESPMGAIYASNISPDPVNGIGKWTLQEFGDALRKGRAPGKGWLYPAMPYTSYAGLSDDDVKALYSYFRLKVAPQATPAPETKLPFPFMRIAMIGWNFLNLHEGKAAGAIPVEGDQLKRGQELVETLGHCSTCHTPRNDLMGEIDSQHLGGGQVGTWNAPNITPSKNGIGAWSDADLKAFLKTGSANNHAAAGDMGLAVEHSFSHLSDADLDAMVAYLRKVPAVDGTAAYAPVGSAKAINVANVEGMPGDYAQKADYASVTDGAALYLGACGTCHGINGEGSTDGMRPSLIKNGTARAYSPDNLIQVVERGIDRTTPSGHAFMPAFASQMTTAQIAALTTYVRVTFGNMPNGVVTEAKVKQVVSGDVKPSWLIANAATLAYVGIAAAVVIVLLIIGFLATRRRPQAA